MNIGIAPGFVKEKSSVVPARRPKPSFPIDRGACAVYLEGEKAQNNRLTGFVKHLSPERTRYMKQCPECTAKNQITNLFCPMCGHSFIDDPADGEGRPLLNRAEGKRVVKSVENRRLFTIIAIVLVVFLGLGAGLTSYLVSREIDRSSLVTIQSGLLWKCSKCGRIYKNTVRPFNVRKSERYDYGIETVTGLCATCKYGPLVGNYQDILEYLSKKNYFGGFAIDLAEPAVVFMNEHQGLFPTSDAARAAEVSVSVDPRLVERDFNSYAGKPIAVKGNVTSLDIVKMPDGSKVTYMQLQPVGESGPMDVSFLVIYKGSAPVFKGDTVQSYLLPSDLVTFRSKKDVKKVVLSVAMYMATVRTAPAD
jgi:hypothetical protein